MLGEQAWRENQTRCQETERDLKKTGNPTPHTLILDLCRTTVLHNLQSSLRDWSRVVYVPRTGVLGYFQPSLRDYLFSC
jgi:hypothetical protein